MVYIKTIIHLSTGESGGYLRFGTGIMNLIFLGALLPGNFFSYGNINLGALLPGNLVKVPSPLREFTFPGVSKVMSPLLIDTIINKFIPV